MPSVDLPTIEHFIVRQYRGSGSLSVYACISRAVNELLLSTKHCIVCLPPTPTFSERRCPTTTQQQHQTNKWNAQPLSFANFVERKAWVVGARGVDWTHTHAQNAMQNTFAFALRALKGHAKWCMCVYPCDCEPNIEIEQERMVSAMQPGRFSRFLFGNVWNPTWTVIRHSFMHTDTTATDPGMPGNVMALCVCAHCADKWFRLWAKRLIHCASLFVSAHQTMYKHRNISAVFSSVAVTVGCLRLSYFALPTAVGFATTIACPRSNRQWKIAKSKTNNCHGGTEKNYFGCSAFSYSPMRVLDSTPTLAANASMCVYDLKTILSSHELHR